eukprot:470795-Prymnesium_polylepis.1
MTSLETTERQRGQRGEERTDSSAPTAPLVLFDFTAFPRVTKKNSAATASGRYTSPRRVRGVHYVDPGKA